MAITVPMDAYRLIQNSMGMHKAYGAVFESQHLIVIERKLRV